MLFDKLDTAKMHGLDMSNVLRRDVRSQVEFGLNRLLLMASADHHGHSLMIVHSSAEISRRPAAACIKDDRRGVE